jgi:ribosomal protein S18 acetylase RimI-like enzyme
MDDQQLDYSISVLSPVTILDFILSNDHLFNPRFTTKVDIGSYIEKVSRRATHFCCHCKGELVGLSMVYLNEGSKHTAYGTYISVREDYQGKGISRKLNQMVVVEARNRGLKFFKIQVRKDNSVIQFYFDFGFEIEKEMADTCILSLKI